MYLVETIWHFLSVLWRHSGLLKIVFIGCILHTVDAVSLSTFLSDQTEYLSPFNGNWEGIYAHNDTDINKKCSIAFVHSRSHYARNLQRSSYNWTLVPVDGGDLAGFHNGRKAEIMGTSAVELRVASAHT